MRIMLRHGCAVWLTDSPPVTIKCLIRKYCSHKKVFSDARLFCFQENGTLKFNTCHLYPCTSIMKFKGCSLTHNVLVHCRDSRNGLIRGGEAKN